MEKQKIKRRAMLFLLLCALGIFAYSGYVLVNYYLESHDQQQIHRELVELTQVPHLEQSAQQDPLPTHVTLSDPKTGEERAVLREYAELYEQNSDLVGWIEVPGTKINLPVMQSSVKDYYLRRDFNKKRANHGSIYVWE